MKKLFFGLTVMLSISGFASSDVILPFEKTSNLNNTVLEYCKDTPQVESKIEVKFTNSSDIYTRTCYYALGIQVYCSEWRLVSNPGTISSQDNGEG